MSTAPTTRGGLVLDDWFARDLPALHRPWSAAAVPAARLLVSNRRLADELGLDHEWLTSPTGVDTLVGNVAPHGATPVAQAYAGHQFGGYSPLLGDGRALLLGEVAGPDGRRHDLHLKGSGATPFSRGGDGKAAVGPMLREYVMSEAMHALGIPTTRSLAVVATGEQVARDTVVPGAVLARTASSHLRVGTFQYAASLDDPDVVRRLADHAIARHHPDLLDQHPAPDADTYLAFFDRVVEAQADLVARWMLVGFIHGVLNTDNVTIAAETIDYGPCAFMEQVDPAIVFSSIDHGGRYAYGNQPPVTTWNLARLAESMLALFHPDRATAAGLATEILQTFPDRYRRSWTAGMRAKLGLVREQPGDAELIEELWPLLEHHHIDMTTWFRSRSAVVRTVASGVVAEREATTPPHDHSPADEPAQLAAWTDRWSARLDAEADPPEAIAAGMDLVNPVYVPRNLLVEAALDAATGGDLVPFHELLGAVTDPFHERPGLEQFAEPAPPGSAPHRTFCGT